MLENASRQALLVLAVLLVSIGFLLFTEQKLGLDLRGGTALAYKVDFEEAQATGDLPGGLTKSDRDEIMNQTVSIVGERIDPSGIVDASVQRRGDDGILIELPDLTEAEALAVQKRIGTLGKLEMRIVANDQFNEGGVEFQIAEEKERLKTWLAEPQNRQAVREDPKRIRLFNSLSDENGGRLSPSLKWYPRKIERAVDDPEEWERAFGLNDQAGNPYVPAYEVSEYTAGPDAPNAPEFLVEFLPINMAEEHFTGEQLDPSGVKPTLDEYGKPALGYAFKNEFKTDYRNWSEKYIKQQSAIILNGYVESAPVFQSAIPGVGIIQGDFSQQEVNELVKVLRTGSLQVKPILESRVEIGATLGAQSVFLGQLSIGIGGAIVLAFILWFYRLSGLVAFGAIVLNLVVLLAVLRFLGATLTLPGIAGLVLTVGMAVDANILIYERIREELERGKELLQAARTGFERAMVTILDANVTTFLAGLVLYNVGVGPVRGFAVTLMVGIATTLFTAFFVSRLLFHYLLETASLAKFDIRRLRLPRINFVGAARPALITSGIVIVAGLIHTFGFVSSYTALGLDFTGGANLRVVLEEPAEPQAVRERLAAHEPFAEQFPRSVVNFVGETDEQGRADEFSIKVKLSDALRREIATAQRKARAEEREYEAPYITALRGALGDLLVDPAYSDPRIAPNPESEVNDFASIELHFNAPVSLAEVRSRLDGVVTAGDGGVEVRTPGASAIESPESSSDLVVEWDVEKQTQPAQLFPMLSDALAAMTAADGGPVKLSEPIPEAQVIQGQIVDELRNYAIAALVIAMFLIVMFVRIRFHEYSYGLAAVAALIHDVLVTLVVVVALNAWGVVTAEIDLAMIAAFLTIIGYSINDTIVIFDRVRENLDESRRLGEKKTFGNILNRSINQTLSRTILTSCTTLFVVLTLFVVNYGSGSGALEGFSLALVVGIISGTYSTVFIATPVVLAIRARSEFGAPIEIEQEPQREPAA